jgi:hypothetical protein
MCRERISLHKSVQCLSPEQKRWPQDIAWHPSGDVIFACYCADGKDDQVAIINTLANVRTMEKQKLFLTVYLSDSHKLSNVTRITPAQYNI